ncbi:hypothetical protein FXN61_44075 [Lentzea sp. PSKA42]|uniref:Uncharacterized protein n=1 Tax=Lentzea indica TaxID=2604800 RepID=A0ABX1FWB4_9PSEU|nr:hypothetical protein [Lentzea indica]NKE63333.1 hypothetical protein [Lentzea indica]
MTEHVVVEWGDKSGGGFVLYTDPRRGAPPGPAFVRVAHDLQDDVVHQPPEAARDNDRFPVWGLQQVEVEDHGPQWCFTVQGRGGAFGRAGTCQFLFAPASADPADVWAHGVALVGPDGRLGHEPRLPSLPAVNATQLVRPLMALAERRKRIAVTGDPTEVAAVIGCLVTALPSAVVAEHIWMTFPLSTPILDKRPSVTGRWPAEQSDNLCARRVERWLEPDPDELPEPQPPRADEAIRWLAQRATGGRRDPAHCGVASLRALLDLIIREELVITEADIGRLVRAHDPRLQDGAKPQMVRRWAAQQTDTAISELLRNPPHWLEPMLFDGVLQAQLRAGKGQNPAKFPPAPAPGGWHTRLADLLRARYHNREELLRFVREHVTAPGSPLGTPDLVQRYRHWLERLGISSTDPSTGIFPVPVKEIVTSLVQYGRISAAHREFLRAASDPIGTLRSVVDRMPEVTPAGAAVLMTVQDNENGMRQVLETVLGHNPHRDERAAAWLDELMKEVTSRRMKGAVITAGVQHLGKYQAGPLPAAFLASVLECWSEQESEQEGDHVVRVLRDAATRLRPATRRIEPGPVFRQDDEWPMPVEAVHTPAAVDDPEVQPYDDDDEQGSPWAVVLFMTTVAVVLFLVVGTVLSRLGTW